MSDKETTFVRNESKNTFYDTLLTIKNQTKLEINVATLARYVSTIQEYDSTKKYGIARLKPFPLYDNETTYYIDAYFLSDRTFTTDSVLIVLYMDKDFTNLIAPSTQEKTSNKNLHSKSFGIIL